MWCSESEIINFLAHNLIVGVTVGTVLLGLLIGFGAWIIVYVSTLF